MASLLGLKVLGTAGLVIVLTASSLYSCGGVSEEQQFDEESGAVLRSEYGTSILRIKDGVLIGGNVRGSEYTKEIVVKHTGAESIELEINDGDSDSIYVFGKVGNTNLTNDSKFGINNGGQIVQISGKDYQNDVVFDNENMIKVPINNGQGTLNWKYVDGTGSSEGKTFVITALNLYDKIQQGSETVLDLGDYFSSFKITFNALPKPMVVGTPNCPVNPVDTDNDGVYDRFEIPLNYDCVSIQFTNPDGIGYNPQYSEDGTNFNDIDYSNPINLTSLGLSQGSTMNKQITVREYVDEDLTILDQVNRTVSGIYKDVDKVGNTDLVGTVQDYTTGNTWTVNDLGAAEFVDPGSNDKAGKITVTGSSAPYGTCDVHVVKDGNELYNQTMPCNNINISYEVPASDRGTGWHGVEFKVYKIYKTGPNDNDREENFIDNILVSYKVNETPTTNP